MANRAIFAVTEILTQVLSNMTRSELLLNARAVNKTWKELVDTSPKLLWITYRLPHTRSTKEKVVTVLPNFFNTLEWHVIWYDRAEAEQPRVLAFNQMRYRWGLELSFKSQEALLERYRFNNFLTALEKTFLTRPPMKRMVIKINGLDFEDVMRGIGGAPKVPELVIEDKKGISVAGFVRKMNGLVGECEFQSFLRREVYRSFNSYEGLRGQYWLKDLNVVKADAQKQEGVFEAFVLPMGSRDTMRTSGRKETPKHIMEYLEKEVGLDDMFHTPKALGTIYPQFYPQYRHLAIDGHSER